MSAGADAVEHAPSGLGQIAIPVHDLGRAVAFYRDVVGLSFAFEAPPQLAFFMLGGVRLMLDRVQDDAFKPPGSILYYAVADIHGSYKAITQRGAQPEAAPHMIAKLPDREVWMAFLRDTEGNLLALMQEITVTGHGA